MRFQCSSCGRSLGYEGLCWKCQDEAERRAILSLSPEQLEEKIQHLLDHAELLDDWDTAEYRDARNLLELLNICPPELQQAAFQAEVFSFDELYYHAPADVRDGLIARLLETTDAQEASELMCCLAMQGDDITLQVLLELEQNPRPWRQELYIDPSVYAQYGGWTFDKAGRRRLLNFDTCYLLEKSDGKQETIRLAVPREDHCPHCGSRLVDILVLDGTDERLRFLGIDGIFTATCCLNCICFAEASFSRYTLDGGSTPLSTTMLVEDVESCFEEDYLAEMAANSFALGANPVPLFYGADRDDLNTIGGFANWVQDWNYTTCPDCGKPMKYLAQLPWETLLEDAEGTLYIEVCPDCQVASVHYQQT